MSESAENGKSGSVLSINQDNAKPPEDKAPTSVIKAGISDEASVHQEPIESTVGEVSGTSESLRNEGDDVVSTGPTAAASDQNAEQFTITEQTALLDGQQIQMVSLMDAAGNVIDQKHGQTGSQVVMKLHGQAFAYEIRGPTESGEAVTVSKYLN